MTERLSTAHNSPLGWGDQPTCIFWAPTVCSDLNKELTYQECRFGHRKAKWTPRVKSSNGMCPASPSHPHLITPVSPRLRPSHRCWSQQSVFVTSDPDSFLGQPVGPRVARTPQWPLQMLARSATSEVAVLTGWEAQTVTLLETGSRNFQERLLICSGSGHQIQEANQWPKGAVDKAEGRGLAKEDRVAVVGMLGEIRQLRREAGPESSGTSDPDSSSVSRPHNWNPFLSLITSQSN